MACPCNVSGMSILTHAEAVDRAGNILVEDMFIELDITKREFFTSRATIRFTAGRSESFVDFKPAEFMSATLNGQAIEDFADGRVLLTGLQERNELVVEGIMAYGTDGEGLHQYRDPVDGEHYLYAMSFLDAAPKWFACFDQPDLKTRFSMEIQAPPDWVILGTGNGTRLGKVRWWIEQDVPISTYLVSIIAGPWLVVEDEHKGIRLALAARASQAQRLQNAQGDILTVTKQCFDAYHGVFQQRYAFGDYVQAFVPDFNAGAMENPGLVLFRDIFLHRDPPTHAQLAARAGTIAHEMAHQWFGNLVTMKWWDDLWLNESFAEYLGHRIATEATEYELWTEFGVIRKNWGASVDTGPATHPVASSGAADTAQALANFDGISYSKGASVVRQLATELGDEIFLGGLNDYLQRHAFGNAEFADLLTAWEDAGAEELVKWAEEWLGKPGMDLLRVERDESGLVLLRESPSACPADRTHVVRCVELRAERLDAGQNLGEGTMQDLIIRDARTPLALRGVGVVVPNALDTTWARIRPSSWEFSFRQVRELSTRVVLFNSIRDAVRSGDLTSARAFELILDAISVESNDTLLSAELEFARELSGKWSPVPERVGRRELVAGICAELLSSADRDSDRELIAAKSLVAATDDVELLSDWLETGVLPSGRAIGQDFRWAIVTQLSARGVGPMLIEDELARDPAGADAAAGARAAQPMLSAKEAALQAILEPSELRAYELYSIGEQLFRPDQSQLTDHLVAAYFEGLPKVAEFRQGWALRHIVNRSFPLANPSRENLILAERLLGEQDDTPLGKALIEQVFALGQVVRACRSEKL